MSKLFEAGKIDDDDILKSVMEALNDIVKVSYDHILDFIQPIGELTMALINSDQEVAA